MSRSKKPAVRKKPRLFRFGIYDPLDESVPVHLYGAAFTDSDEDQRRVLQVFAAVRARIQNDAQVYCVIGLFPVSSRRSKRVMDGDA